MTEQATSSGGTAATDDDRRPGVEEIWAIQPGLARLMPEIGTRFWKCWYAAQADNWPNADYQMREMKKLMRICNVTRPKYQEDMDAYMRDTLAPLVDAIAARDLDAFTAAYQPAVDRANQLHAKWNKPYIVWQLPSSPPPDLDLTPRE